MPTSTPTGDLEKPEKPDKHPIIDLTPTIVASDDYSHYTENYGPYWGPKLEVAHIAVDTNELELANAEKVLAELHQQANLALKTGDLGPPLAPTPTTTTTSTPTPTATSTSAAAKPESQPDSESRSFLRRK